jgi:hypothetical protein
VNRTEPALPCPHCGREMRVGILRIHAPLCIQDPAVFARYRDVLTAAPGGITGITCGRYIELSTADKTLPTVNTLRNLTGVVPWGEVLAVFGLLPPAVNQRPPSALVVCPQCGIRTGKLGLHVCPEEPTIVAWMARNLPNPSRPDYIIVQTDYDAIEHKPLGASALKRVYGSWAGLARRYGMKCQPSRGSAPGMKTGGVVGMDPVSRAELHRLADLLHAGDFGPSFSEFAVHAEDAPLTASGLERRFGTWGAVLAAADLRHGSRSEYHHAANSRRKTHQRPQNERRGRGSFDRGDEPISRDFTGIPVFPNPRTLPTGGVAWTVR